MEGVSASLSLNQTTRLTAQDWLGCANLLAGIVDRCHLATPVRSRPHEHDHADRPDHYRLAAAFPVPVGQSFAGIEPQPGAVAAVYRRCAGPIDREHAARGLSRQLFPEDTG